MPESKKSFLIVYPDSSCFSIYSEYDYKPKTGGGRRGEITGFSRASQKRLMDFVNTIERDEIRKANIITLTYHQNFTDHEQSKNHLKRFLQALRRLKPDSSGIWRLEYQKRAAIHYHVLQFGGFIHHSKIAEVWNRIAENGDRDHLRAGTQIKRVSDVRNVQAYICKYLGKLDQSSCAGEGVNVSSAYRGRYWGYFNRSKIPVGRHEAIPITCQEAVLIRDHWRASKSLGNQPGTLTTVYSASERDLKSMMRKNDEMVRNIRKRQASANNAEYLHASDSEI